VSDECPQQAGDVGGRRRVWEKGVWCENKPCRGKKTLSRLFRAAERIEAFAVFYRIEVGFLLILEEEESGPFLLDSDLTREQLTARPSPVSTCADDGVSLITIGSEKSFMLAIRT